MLKSILHKTSEKQTTVVNLKNSDYDVYIGRGSKWGNPYSHKTNTAAKFVVSSRKEAIESYRKYLFSKEGEHLLNDLHELKGKVLGCYCKPLCCHGDILAELANSLSRK